MLVMAVTTKTSPDLGLAAFLRGPVWPGPHLDGDGTTGPHSPGENLNGDGTSVAGNLCHREPLSPGTSFAGDFGNSDLFRRGFLMTGPHSPGILVRDLFRRGCGRGTSFAGDLGIGTYFAGDLVIHLMLC